MPMPGRALLRQEEGRPSTIDLGLSSSEPPLQEPAGRGPRQRGRPQPRRAGVAAGRRRVGGGQRGAGGPRHLARSQR
eukprot:6905159-Pyramimonas_sp.AAC.1